MKNEELTLVGKISSVEGTPHYTTIISTEATSTLTISPSHIGRDNKPRAPASAPRTSQVGQFTVRRVFKPVTGSRPHWKKPKSKEGQIFNGWDATRTQPAGGGQRDFP